MFLDHLENVRLVTRGLKIKKAQTPLWNSLSSGSIYEVFELFFIDELFCFRNTGDKKTNTDLRSWFLVASYLQAKWVLVFLVPGRCFSERDCLVTQGLGEEFRGLCIVFGSSWAPLSSQHVQFENLRRNYFRPIANLQLENSVLGTHWEWNTNMSQRKTLQSVSSRAKGAAGFP